MLSPLLRSLTIIQVSIVNYRKEMTDQFQDIQKLKVGALRKEFSQKVCHNPHYSLRAFARDLDLSHTLLSLIFSNKRPLTNSTAQKLVSNERLGEETRSILSLGHIKKDEAKVEFQRLTLQSFAMISDWVHYAVLSLTEIIGFRWDATWIARKLRIGEGRAKTVMNRLTELNFIQKNEFGNYKQSVGKIVIGNKESTEAAQLYNKGLLKKAVQSMSETQFIERDLSSTTFAMDPQYIPYAIERIRSFRRELTQELEGLGAKKEVYALAVQIFPLSKNEENQ
jgi:uncharacterized protein (TIGR02147 family)